MQSRTDILVILGLLVLAGILIAGCTQQQMPEQTTTTAAPAATAGLANPASVYCGERGGTLEIKKDAAGGEYGMCTFPNSTSCEEWALFRGEGCKPGVELATTPAADSGMPNPAAVYCGEVGGMPKALMNPDGSEYGMCVFPNDTACEEWALYRGEGCKQTGA
jgi:putative hemolysin